MWTPEIEAVFRGWIEDLQIRATWSRRYYLFWKFVALLYIPVTVIAWIFGSKGLAETEKSSHTEDIVLLVVGAATLVLDKLKPRKYKLFHKRQESTYRSIANRLELQLARPREQRKSPDDLLRKIQVELKVMGMQDSTCRAPVSSRPHDQQLNEVLVE